MSDCKVGRGEKRKRVSQTLKHQYVTTLLEQRTAASPHMIGHTVHKLDLRNMARWDHEDCMHAIAASKRRVEELSSEPHVFFLMEDGTRLGRPAKDTYVYVLKVVKEKLGMMLLNQVSYTSQPQ